MSAMSFSLSAAVLPPGECSGPVQLACAAANASSGEGKTWCRVMSPAFDVVAYYILASAHGSILSSNPSLARVPPTEHTHDRPGHARQLAAAHALVPRVREAEAARPEHDARDAALAEQ